VERPELLNARDRQLVALATAPLVLILLASAVARRRLFANAFDVRLVALLALTRVACVTHRFLAVRHDVGLATIFVDELVLVAFASAAAAVTLTPRFAATIPIVLAGATVIELRPGSVIPTYPITILLAFVMLGAIVWRRR